MFPTGGQFHVSNSVWCRSTLPYEDVEVAIQTGELDGVAWCGITEMYTVGWADVTSHYLTNNISGAWAGSYFRKYQQLERTLPEHLQDPVQADRSTILALLPTRTGIGGAKRITEPPVASLS
jgi:hypothetical protein